MKEIDCSHQNTIFLTHFDKTILTRSVFNSCEEEQENTSVSNTHLSNKNLISSSTSIFIRRFSEGNDKFDILFCWLENKSK